MADPRLQRTELSAVDIDRRAITILELLDGISLSQAIRVLDRARELAEWTTVVDSNGGLVNQEREALGAPPVARDEAA